MNRHQYDVAFSFLGQDEPTASALNDLLAERFSTFLYSKQQERLAGTDGELTFSEVFAKQSRVVVILYREAWGKTPWTRIEETAIRGRAYDDGYDFTLFIPLDAKPVLPDWLPKTQLWFGLERFGMQGAASVIEARIQQAGGTARPETAMDRAARLSRDMQRAEERARFLSSERGMKAATEYVAALLAELETLAQAIAAANPTFALRVERAPTQAALSLGGHSLTVAWSVQYANSLEGSALYVKTWRGPSSLRWQGPSREELHCWEYDFERLASGAMGWRASTGDKRFFQDSSLADHCLKQLLDLAARTR